MTGIKYITFVVVLFLMSACDKNEITDKLIGINPSTIKLSNEQPESYFQLAKGDYNIEGFFLSYNENETPISVSIDKEIRKKEQFTITMPNGNEAKFLCKNGIILKIELGFMTLSKVGYGKYKILYNEDTKQKRPFSMTIGFFVPDGISTVHILFK